MMAIPGLCTAMAEHSLWSSRSCKHPHSYQKAKAKVCFAAQNLFGSWSEVTPDLSRHHHGSRTHPGAGTGLGTSKCCVLSVEQSLKPVKPIKFVSG